MRYVVLSVLSLMLAVTLLAPQLSAADKPKETGWRVGSRRLTKTLPRS